MHTSVSTLVYHCLQGLIQVEEMLISAVMPIMSLYKLPHGQYGYTGHVVNLPQDVASFAYNLPRLPSDLDVLVVRREGANHTHRDLRGRRGVVHRALQRLVTRNQYYHSLGITIDFTALEQLPQDGNVSDLLSVTDECSLPDIPSTTTTTATSNTPTTSDTVELEDNLPQSFVPMTEQEAVQQSVDQGKSTSSSRTPPLEECH